MFKGEYTRKVVYRAYTDKQIKKILDVSDLRAKTIVLLMASSGLRIGALPDIRIRNLEKINNIYKITVYEGSNSQYFTFCTPECSLTSRFSITVIQLEDSILKVVYSKEWDRPSYEEMIRLVIELKYCYRPQKIYVDGANPDFIRSLKIQFNENTDYEKVIERAKHDKIDHEYRMFVIPVNFNEFAAELLGRFQYCVSKKWFAMSEVEHKELVQQMRTARYKENGNLDKDESAGVTYDSLDSCRLALKMFEKGLSK